MDRNKEKDTEKREGELSASAARRQSLVDLGAKTSRGNNWGNNGDAKADRRASLPSSALLQGAGSDSEAGSIPVNTENGGPSSDSVHSRSDGSAASRPDWSRGHSHVSRLNAEMGSP
jgi:hypothetical protein